ncbi:hypothetical protein [Clostridium botulinum]|uniref:Uncharacterized protein n=2 Tax=Clostridium botulinum TaxID=1491 RepID=A5HYD2_CLOBH|nr:hypothetical protein [Clostridium botulinum]EKN41013.1 hypothetical protein CFSAN001627_15868 [Clostridium botulinum CFSAN001627]EPS46259.1 hypothetical protein CFSAN002369_26771 [Clostridium botulinum CFSAN002369]EPS46366.1 hypothetical protein CFSAN002367_28116 [Clostridium botulinum CFSAN002367]ABS35718.1 hypothetical protein CLB_0282 [Clostridium botulinum A str. ATCC 19397]ABS36568.1 hypothetical protein CLC_0297 [Clostridium botulinum A str. Hall]
MKADKTFNAIKYRKGRHMPALELELEYEDKPYEERQSKIHSKIYLNHAA